MSHNDGLPPLRDVIARHNLQASKALGQNFLFDEQLLDRIAAVPGSLAGETVFEVGPGPGGLTRALLRAGANVTAVERDDRCLPALEELKEPYPDRLAIISGDAMKISAAEIFDTAIHIIANLPYNVGTALLVNWLTEQVWPPYWKSLTLMFQKEVAERIVAKPGSSAYGRLSVLSQWRSTANISMNVHRSAFTPAPKVMSAVVHITPNPSDGVVSPKTMGHLTAAAFGQRRKMLRQSLKSIPKAVAGLEELGIDPKRRAETVSVEEFTALARLISA